MRYKTDYKRVAGLGSAKDGTRHWWLQRITSIALIPLSFIFVYIVGSSLGEENVILSYLKEPFAAIAMILFLIVGFHHLQQGLQVVIEDYVHTKRTATILFILNIFLCWFFAIMGIYAVFKLSL